MGKNIANLAGAIVTTAFLLVGCQSPDEKLATAQAKVQDANQKLAMAQNNMDSATQKAAIAEEWAIFRTDAEAKIKGNEIRIAALKTKLKKPATEFDTMYKNRIDTLEQRNRDMQTRIDLYAKNQDAWESFKLEFTADMDSLASALKEVAAGNNH